MQPVPLSTTNSSLPGQVVSPIKQGKAVFRTPLQATFQIQLEVVFKIRNPTQFQLCLNAINDPSSPYYEKFLNATTLEPFLPTPGQKASVTSLLQRHGFSVTPGYSPLVLKLNGTVNDVKSALGLQLALYAYGDTNFYAANSDPQLPSNLAGLVSGMIGLENFTRATPVETPCTGPFCPQGIQVGYTLSNLISSGHDATGQTVAIVDEPGDPSPQSAINTYSTQYGLPAITLSLLTPDGTPTSYDPGWGSEAAMDIEAVHSAAPGAGIDLVYIPPSNDLMDGIDYVASNHLANAISNSWTYSCGSSACPDTQLGSAFVNSEDTRLATDVAQGVTVLFASGDSGSNPGGSLGTEFPSSDPNVLAVGATNLVLSGCGTTTCSGYGSETGASISGGGYSLVFSEPSWQSTTIGTTSGRAVPDVSMLGYNPAFWVYSTLSDKCGTSGSVANSWFGCAGTSLSTPLWAGVLSIVIQVRGGVQLGNVGPRLYQLASSSEYASTFHDITSGSNGAYGASNGWDPVTGWGTPQANNFALAFSATLTTNVASGSGSVSPNCPSGCFELGGSSISVSATPSAGWSFSQWAVTGAACSGGVAVNPCSFTMPSTAVIVSANFLEPTTISLSLSSQTINLGSSIILSGSISPNPGAQLVTISISPDNRSWTPLISVNTNSGGSYSTPWTPPYPGNFGLEASWGGNNGFEGSTSSPPKGLSVTGTRALPPTLLLTTASTVSTGSQTSLSITIFNPAATPLTTQLTVEILGPGNYAFFDTINVQVTGNSQNTTIYYWTAPNQSGTYTVTVQTLPPQLSAYDSTTISVS